MLGSNTSHLPRGGGGVKSNICSRKNYRREVRYDLLLYDKRVMGGGLREVYLRR
jgi:hypothetical protein